jgi:molybdopterin converting factor small subunit
LRWQAWQASECREVKALRIMIEASSEFRRVIGEVSIVELKEGADLNDLISELGHRTGMARQGFIGHYKAGAADLVILVNARNVGAMDKPISLKDEDIVTFLTPATGG